MVQVHPASDAAPAEPVATPLHSPAVKPASDGKPGLHKLSSPFLPRKTEIIAASPAQAAPVNDGPAADHETQLKTLDSAATASNLTASEPKLHITAQASVAAQDSVKSAPPPVAKKPVC